MHNELAAIGVTHTVVDAADPRSWAAALRPQTKLFYCEAISNPLIEVCVHVCACARSLAVRVFVCACACVCGRTRAQTTHQVHPPHTHIHRS